MRQENVFNFFSHFICKFYTSEKTVLFLCNRNYLSSETLYKINSLTAHPVRHKYSYGMSESSSEEPRRFR